MLYFNDTNYEELKHARQTLQNKFVLQNVSIQQLRSNSTISNLQYY